MKKVFAMMFLLASLNGLTQDDKKLVEEAVLDYVEGFYFGDTSRLIRSISPMVVKYGYYKKKDETKYTGEPMSFQEMKDYANSVRKKNDPNAGKQSKKVEVLDVQDQTASAKLYAWWGTDYILLAKMNGKWMITHVLWQSLPGK